MAVVYSIGYSASVFRRSRWMSSLETTNVLAALALSVTIALLIGPVADLRKIAVDSQVARLRSGRVPASEFDFAMLQREGGRWGHDALEQLAADNALSPEARAVAKDLLATGSVARQGQDPGAALARLQGELRVLPSGAVRDAKLLELFSRRYADWNESNCTRSPAHCALWVADLDGDGVSEAVLLSEANKSTTAVLYAQGDQGWHREGQLVGATNSLADWISAIDAKRVSPAKPRWPELQVGAKRYTVQR
jgi:hypothetical protein